MDWHALSGAAKPVKTWLSRHWRRWRQNSEPLTPSLSPSDGARGKYFGATFPGGALGPCGRPPELTPGYYLAALSGRSIGRSARARSARTGNAPYLGFAQVFPCVVPQPRWRCLQKRWGRQLARRVRAGFAGELDRLEACPTACPHFCRGFNLCRLSAIQGWRPGQGSKICPHPSYS